MVKEFLKDFKKYIGDFEYDLVLLSDKRIAIINQSKNNYIEYHDEIMMTDILECFCSLETSLKDFFDTTIRFSNDDYLKNYLVSMEAQIV